MRLLPWDYGVRNLSRRPLRTALTALGLTLVVFLLLLVVGFVRGLELSLHQSGDPEVVLLHNANAAENLENSSISDEVTTLARTEFAPYLVRYGDTAAVSPELTIASRIGASDTGSAAQLGVLRGVDWDRVFLVRRQAFLMDGKLPGRDEVLVGRLVAAKLGLRALDLAVGSTLTIEGRPWRISGTFAAPGTLLESEIWCPLDDLKVAMKRPNDVSVVAMRFDPKGDAVKQMGYVDYFCRNRRPDLELMGSREAEYYSSLQKHYGPMRTLAWLLVGLVAIAGGCGAVNTMYAAVAGRVREFGALQAVGFPRRSIAFSLLQESVILAAAATLAATGLALLLIQGVAVRFTMGAFTLQLDRLALLIGCGAGLGLGIFGAIPPAVRAFRMSIVDALKAV
ncbi:MAG TPA: ABC transporter permease [Gemmataceae bacterium]|jgi:ABC-type antimicrobial peptide transport system permease subunit|nr:ABC transporter permease [Gemmataceae bacterium]